MIEAQEMKKISFLCPFEKVLQTYWYKQIIVSSKSLMSKLVFNYLAFYSESKEFEFIGNETSAKIRFVWDNSAKDSQNIKLYHTNDLKEFNSKIKIKKSSLKSSFDSNYFSRIQRNELQIFQDRYLIENNRQIFKINEFLHAGTTILTK